MRMNESIFKELSSKKPFTYFIDNKCYVIGYKTFFECSEKLTALCREYLNEFHFVKSLTFDLEKRDLKNLIGIYDNIINEINIAQSQNIDQNDLRIFELHLNESQRNSVLEQIKGFTETIDWKDKFFLI